MRDDKHAEAIAQGAVPPPECPVHKLKGSGSWFGSVLGNGTLESTSTASESSNVKAVASAEIAHASTKDRIKSNDKHSEKISKGTPPPECPVHKIDRNEVQTSGGWMSLVFGSSSTERNSNAIADACGSPSTNVSSGAVLSNKVDVAGYNAPANDLAFNQERQPDQTLNMSIKRSVSNIPKSDFTPPHQPLIDADQSGKTKQLDHWVYPSEQQYYNAMKKKGYNPPEKDIGAILAIHNMVNETGWQKVCEWEAFRGCTNSKLKRFLGRPTELSPKARFLTWIGREPPFDRHDWIVERENGQQVRYVIDFYHVPNQSSHGVLPVHMDVRPALDTPRALIDRLEMQFRQRFLPNTLSGIKSNNAPK